jgi:ubiquinone/menaquinone biosynthesis C-methylase UbiE
MYYLCSERSRGERNFFSCYVLGAWFDSPTTPRARSALLRAGPRGLGAGPKSVGCRTRWQVPSPGWIIIGSIQPPTRLLGCQFDGPLLAGAALGVAWIICPDFEADVEAKLTEFTEIEKKTKALYIKQHRAYMQDTSIFDRFYNVASKEETYGVPKGFFQGKHIVDIGCGNTAYFQMAMHDLGAAHVTCLDIGDDWKTELQSALDGLGVSRDFYTMVAGSATELPFDDNSFDFVASNGVIMHLNGVDVAERAFAEMARVTKRGGMLYAYTGLSTGIIDNYVLAGMRQAYLEQPKFKEFIDNLTPDTLTGAVASVLDTTREHDPDIAPAMENMLGLLTLDTITFWQNVLQVPVQQGTKLDRAWAEGQFAKHGFFDVRRTPSTFWHRNDARRFLAPFHYNTSNPVSQLLYGDGHLKFTGVKPD